MISSESAGAHSAHVQVGLEVLNQWAMGTWRNAFQRTILETPHMLLRTPVSSGPFAHRSSHDTLCLPATLSLFSHSFPK